MRDRVRRGCRGRSRARVLPLALAGLASLGHRGAFGADGASSDGAGIALPLDRSVLTLIAGPELAAARPAVVMLFLPRERAAAARARALVETTLAAAGLPVVAWRDGPGRSRGARRRRRGHLSGRRPGRRRPPAARRC